MNSSKELMVGEKPLSSLRVVDLKEELEKRSLSKSGSKKDLADRLKNYLLAERQKEAPVPAADEEQLPNISMQEKLAEQNPFIRDYFASQAELFHSQKVAKKLLEEEARRESETSAPSADEESSAAEDRSPRKEVEEVQKGKVKRLARRFENHSRGSKVEEVAPAEMTVDKPSVEEMPEISIGKPVEIASTESSTDLKKEEVVKEVIPVAEPESKTTDKSLDKPAKTTSEAQPEELSKEKETEEPCKDKEAEEPSKNKEAEEPSKNKEAEEPSADKKVEDPSADKKVEDPSADKKVEDPSADKKVDELFKESEASDLTASINKEDIKVTGDPRSATNDESSSASSSSPAPEPEVKSPEQEVKSPEPSPTKSAEKVATGSDSSENKGVEEKAQLKAAAQDGAESEISKNGNVKKLTERFESSVPQEPVVVEAEKPVDKEISVPEDEDDADSESSESSRSRSRSPTDRRAGSPSKRTSTSPTRKDSSPDDDRKPRNRKLAESFDRKSDDASRDEELEISMEVDDQIEMGPTRNGESEKRKTISPVKKQATVVQIKARSEDETRSSQRKLPELIDDEEALDYGEEENKLKIEPARFTWTKRILRLKNKHLPKEQSGKRWKMPEDMNSPIINTEYLMQWFPEVKLVPASEFKLEEKEKTPSRIDQDVEKVEITRKVSLDSVDPNQPPVENITITRKVSLIPMVPSAPSEDVDKDLSPPRHPPSELILITNLTRPFTLPQLKELLQRTGNLLDVWVDKIKSRCIAKYEKQEEAFETRAALHGVNWPQSNPKALSVDYTTQERLDDYKARDAGVDVKPVRVEKPETADNTMPVREWDMGKRGKSRSPHRVRKSSRSASRERKRPRRSQSPGLNRRRHSRSPHHDRRSRGDAKDAEPLGKALDELFRKTAATPSIYWLPLTPQQIAEKEELRRKRMIERERRLAEMSKMRPR